MALPTFKNLAVMTVSGTPGTGTITLSAAVPPYLTLAQAGITDGQIVTYSITDGASNSEIGQGTYTSSGTTLSRDTVYRSTGASNTAKISATSAAIVEVTIAAEDFALLGGGVVEVDYYTSSATITIPTGATRALVEMVGAGGASGSCAAGGCAVASVSGNASAGTALEKYLTGLVGGKTLTWTRGAAGVAAASGNNAGGAGGSSSLATGPAGNPQTISTLTCPGGLGGGGAASGTNGAHAAVPSIATGGDLNWNSTPNINAINSQTQVQTSQPPRGWGASSLHRVSGTGLTTGLAAAPTGYGAAAGGSYSAAGGGAAQTGKDGVVGILKITWFY